MIDIENTKEQKYYLNKLNSIVKKIDSSYYVQTLFDPVQTHGVYSVLSKDVFAVKQKLRKLKANKFRVVKAHGKLRIVTFNSSKMDL